MVESPHRHLCTNVLPHGNQGYSQHRDGLITPWLAQRTRLSLLIWLLSFVFGRFSLRLCPLGGGGGCGLLSLLRLLPLFLWLVELTAYV